MRPFLLSGESLFLAEYLFVNITCRRILIADGNIRHILSPSRFLPPPYIPCALLFQTIRRTLAIFASLYRGFLRALRFS